MNAIIKDIKVTPSGVYAIAVRGIHDEFDVMLNSKLPRWDALTSGSYMPVDPFYWLSMIEKLRSKQAIK